MKKKNKKKILWILSIMAILTFCGTGYKINSNKKILAENKKNQELQKEANNSIDKESLEADDKNQEQLKIEEDKKKQEELKIEEDKKKQEDQKLEEDKKKQEALKVEEEKKKQEEDKKQQEPNKQQITVANNTKQETVKEVSKGFKHNAFSGSNQVLMVTASSMTTSYGTAQAYERQGDGWNLVYTIPVRLGTNGMEYIASRRQSTNKTPAGIMNIISAFGVAGNPGTQYSYHNVQSNDYWDLNSGSPTYNRLIKNNPGGDYEELASYPNQYKYALVTDYNYNQGVDKGGAIFIHVNGKGSTGGCVSMSEGDLVNIMKWMKPGQNPKVLVIPKSDVSKYYY